MGKASEEENNFSLLKERLFSFLRLYRLKILQVITGVGGDMLTRLAPFLQLSTSKHHLRFLFSTEPAYSIFLHAFYSITSNHNGDWSSGSPL